jgi:sRNA-binding regulator protein Hfq
VTFNINPDMEGGGPGSGFVTDPVTGRTHNVAATLPEDDSYSPLWWVSVYDNADFDNVSDLASAQSANILASGVANVNCPVVMVEQATSVENNIEDPFTFRLQQNFPNPFRGSTQIRFTAVKNNKITLKVFNLNGKQVAILIDQVMQPGEYSVTWNAENQTGGIYFYTISAGSYHETKKMTLLK